MEKINNKEAIFLIVSCSLGITVLVSSQIIVSGCLSASLINTGYISFIAITLTFIVCSLYKKFIGISFLDITEFLGGKFLKFIVGIAFLLYFIFTASIVLCKAVNCLQIVYYPMTHPNYTVLLFAISAGIACNLKNNGFMRATFIIVPIVIVAIVFIFVGNLKNFNYDNIFPIMGHGWSSTFIEGATNLFTFGGIAYMFFLPQNLKRPDKFMSISIISTVISSILLTFVTATIILMFNKNVTSGQLFPIYIAVRYIEFGTFFQRLDSAFLLILNIAICSFLGIYANLCVDIIKEIIGVSDSRPISYSFCLLLYASTIIIESKFELEFIQNHFFKTFFFSIISVGLLILLFANFKKLFLKENSSLYEKSNLHTSHG